MSNQQQGAYDSGGGGMPPGTMGGLVHSVDSYLNEMATHPSGHIVPQPRGQSLQHRPPVNDYGHQQSNAQYGYNDYGHQMPRQDTAMYDRSMMENTASNGHYRSGSYGASTDMRMDGGYGYGGYGNNNNPAMYGQNYSYPTTTTQGGGAGNNYGMPQYPPQHLVDGPSGVVPAHSSPPVASAQPEYPIHRSPPASPTARHSYQQMMMHQQQQQMQMQMQYQQPQPSYSQPAPPQQQPPQPLSSSSSTGHASRPSSQDYARSTTTNTTTMHRRNHSSAKMINTIERPKYAIPSAIDTSQTGADGDEVPFVAVSPISSDDEDDDYPPVVTQQQHQQQQQPPPPPPPHPYPSTTFSSETQEEEDVLQQHQPPPPPPRFSLAQPEAQEHVEQQQQERLKPTHNRYSSLSLEVNVDYSILTELSTAFKNRMKRITNVREVKSSNEYPESFSGQEAISLLQEILTSKNIPEGYCVLIANALMNCSPPLFQPIRQNYKSLITNEVYNSSDQFYTFDEDLADNELPVGIFTSLSQCYTYNCLPGQGGCYAPRCPNKPDVFEEDIMSQAVLARRPSDPTLSPVDDTKTFPHTAWAERVPRELLENTPKRERDRQEAINEMIYSEEVYRSDLDTLRDVIVEPLRRSNVISESRRGHFIKSVFQNFETLRELSDTLFKKLLDLQRKYEGKCIPGIGDILVDEFKYYSDPYTTYTPNVPLAEYLVAVEKQRNPEFARFIADCEKHERFRRLAFRHFLLNPVTRMQRYPLLLQAIIKKTDEDHIDRRYLLNCKEMIQAIASRSDMQTAAVKQQVEILSINDVLTCKPGELHDVQLTDPQRRLYHRGDLKRRAQAIEVTEKSDIHAFVFDHMLLMTKVRKGSHGDTEYRIWKRPIPMQMLFVQSLGGDYYGSTTTTTATSTSSTSATLTSTSSATAAAALASSSSATTPTPAMVSLTLQHLGHRDGIYHFFVASHEEKQQWIRAIEEAKTALRKRQGDNDVFEVRTLDDASFRYFGSVAGQGRISCSVPFVSMTGERKIVIGTDAGVFIKTEGQSSVRPVLSCDNVTQVAVMERHHILLVLTDKVLKAYSIDALDAPKSTRNSDRAYEVAQNVNFFQVGFCNYKDLVVYKKKKSTSSVFVALEPVCNMRDAKSEKLFTQRTGLFSSRGSGPSWFKLYKEFYVGAEASNIHFLKSKVSVVVESRGFEIIDPENLVVGGRNIPDSADPQFNFIQRHAEPLKPLAMYRIQDKFLLCYNRFAFYVNNRNGSLVQRGAGKSSILCEWNGSPDHIVYQHPYILAVDQQFIEIRHVDTGELVQIIKGDNLRLTHYNGGETPIIHGCMTHSQRPDMQHLFQLCLSNQHNQRANSGRRSMR